MKEFSYRTQGVCARQIDFTLDGDVIVNVKFIGGCAGNTAGVASLIAGMRVEDAIGRLRGIRCGFKSTSCPDQLATALAEALSTAK